MFKRKGIEKSYRFYRKRSKRERSFRFLDLGIAFLGLFTFLFLLSSAKRLTQTQAEGSSKTIPLRLQVLNASGFKLNPKVIKLVESKKIGSYYLVVVEEEDFPDSLVKETLLLDRIGDKKLARLVGEKLGLRRENILSRKLENDYLNISYTLILGQDHPKLLKLKDKD